MFSYYSMIPICLITGDINIDHLWWCLSGFSIVKSPFFLWHLRNICGGDILRNADILSLILHSFSFSIHWWFLPVIRSIIVLAKWWFFYFHHFFYIYWLKYTMRKSCPFCICTCSVIKFLSLCPYFFPHMGHNPLLSLFVLFLTTCQICCWDFLPVGFMSCDKPPLFCDNILTFWQHKMLHVHLFLSLCQPWNLLFLQGFLVPFLETVFWNKDLVDRLGPCYCGVISSKYL